MTLNLSNKIIIKHLKNYRTINTTKICRNLSPNNVMNVFDRNVKLLQRERSANNSDVKIYDYIKDEIGYRLADRIFDIKREFKVGLDLGCGRGHVAKNIVSDSIKKLIITDMSETYLNQAALPDNIEIEKRLIDEENFLLDENSIDIVVSCLSLHWVNDLPGCFEKIIRVLKNDGVFMAAVFGGDTLYELR